MASIMKKAKDVDTYLFLIDGLFTAFTMSFHTLCTDYIRVHFMDERARDFIAYIYLCKYVYYWRKNVKNLVDSKGLG